MSNCRYLTAIGVHIRQESDDNFIFYWNERGYEGNAVTASIIQACRIERNVDQLVVRICREFQVDREEARVDIEEIVQQLCETGILLNQFHGGIQ